MNYIFDIDGTLTPSRLPIDPEFEKFFLEWMKDKKVYFVTGSDKDKTIRNSYIKKGEECAKLFITYLSKEQYSETESNSLE